MEFFKKLTPVQKKNTITLSVLGAMLISLGIYGWLMHRPAPADDYSMALPQTTTLESRVLFGGDVYWGRRMHDWSQQSSLKAAYPFSRLHEFDRDKYDAWVINLECPAVPGVKQPIGFVPQLWEFNCDTDYLPEAAKWFDAVSLGNNHIANQQREKGLEATRNELNRLGVQHFGHIEPHKKSEACSVIALPARASIDGTQQEVKLPVAMCAYHGVYYTITDNALSEIKKYAPYMPVIVYPHMGREYQATADEKRRTLYQKMIDNGADVVFGNHPHWVQPTEVYKGKLIVYSMGNFIFDQQFSEEVTRAAAFATRLTIPANSVSPELLRNWLALGESCTGANDDCLAQAEAKQLTRLPIHFSYDIVGVDLSNQITHKANMRVYDGILTRLNWHDTAAKLGQH